MALETFPDFSILNRIISENETMDATAASVHPPLIPEFQPGTMRSIEEQKKAELKLIERRHSFDLQVPARWASSENDAPSGRSKLGTASPPLIPEFQIGTMRSIEEEKQNQAPPTKRRLISESKDPAPLRRNDDDTSAAFPQARSLSSSVGFRPLASISSHIISIPASFASSITKIRRPETQESLYIEKSDVLGNEDEKRFHAFKNWKKRTGHYGFVMYENGLSSEFESWKRDMGYDVQDQTHPSTGENLTQSWTPPPRSRPPSSNAVIEEVGQFRVTSLPPIESKLVDDSAEQEIGNQSHYDTNKRTCTLNLVCYRSGLKGCKVQQLCTARKDRFLSSSDFNETAERMPGLIWNDRQFFEALRNAYDQKMCNFWQRKFFLKSLTGIRLLSITPTTRPAIVPLDDFVIQEILYAYQNPSTIVTDHDWIDWVFRLRQRDRRHALEFVEGWNGTRIAIAGLTPLLISCILGVVWSWQTGDVQTAFTVAGFVLTAGTLVLALLAIISGIEASGRAST